MGFSWARDYLAGYLAAHIIADIRSELFLHLETLSLKFFQKRQIGEIMARLLNDVNRIQELLTSTLLMFLTNVLLLIAILVYLLNVNWQLTLIAIIPVPLTIFFTNRIGGRLHNLSRGSAGSQCSYFRQSAGNAFGNQGRESLREMSRVSAGDSTSS